MYHDKLYNKNRKLIFWSQTGQAAVFKTGGITMALAGKIRNASTVVGASILPQTHEEIFTVLPLIGLSLLLIIIGFSYYNYRLDKKLIKAKLKGD